ncbi:uncharacterized protein METZ01_LOCUS406656 [marine metagenome]|uniref:CYTH domain-containing protein n=1 Tax=marine metagenome TaxID=408172 RepID=A0A382W4P7_9ZZZZ
MPFEIERKFLVNSNIFKQNAQTSNIKQAYLSISDNISVRVRIDDVQASLAIKSKISERVNREYEYSIPIDEAHSIMNLSQLPTIIKTRYLKKYGAHTWEIDEFEKNNKGLIIAEIELNNEDEEFEIPTWVGKEITSDYRYLNSNLAIKPFNKW